MREYFDLVREVFEETWRTEITEMEEVGPDLLVIGSRSAATGKAGGVPVEQTFWQAGQARGGKIVWWKFCRTRAEALEAARSREP